MCVLVSRRQKEELSFAPVELYAVLLMPSAAITNVLFFLTFSRTLAPKPWSIPLALTRILLLKLVGKLDSQVSHQSDLDK